jgi:hypothetical protein
MAYCSFATPAIRCHARPHAASVSGRQWFQNRATGLTTTYIKAGTLPVFGGCARPDAPAISNGIMRTLVQYLQAGVGGYRCYPNFQQSVLH